MNEIVNSIDRCRNFSNFLNVTFHSLLNALEFNQSWLICLYSLDKLICNFSEMRGMAKKKQICEYETLKFCELFFLTLHYAIKHKIEYLIDFIHLSQKFILLYISPIFSKTKEFKTRHQISNLFG